MNIFWLLQGDGPFFGKWQVGSGGCFLAGGGWLLIYLCWWWVVVDVFWLVVGRGGYILDGGGWWWMVVGRGIVQSNPKLSISPCQQSQHLYNSFLLYVQVEEY